MVPRVLVADDDSDLRAAVASSLAAEGMSVVEARSGSEALAKLASGDIDLLVTDVMMPDLGGVQAAAMARAGGAHLPILVMTGRRDPWIAESVEKLQRAALLYKPFSSEDLVAHANALLEKRETPSTPPPEESEPHLFPPALVPLLRKSVGESALLESIPDHALVELLSVIFFAGLETEEGERHPVRVVLVPSEAIDSEPPTNGVPAPLYRWSTLRFEHARPLSINELVKLAAAMGGSGREHVQVIHERGGALITGIAREGVNIEGDCALKIVVDRPGGLSVRMGRHHVLDYEHGRVQSLATCGVILTAGPVRRALEAAAARFGLSQVGAARYLDAVRMLIAKLSAHGHGGILVFGATREPVGEAGYRTHTQISVAAMLARLQELEVDATAHQEQSQLLAGALSSEIQNTIVELGGLTALDGATFLDWSLALVGFGIVLPVGNEPAAVVEAEDVEATKTHPFDLGGRGTRHRAAATYASTHPESVVFVASQDGAVGCLYRAAGGTVTMMWRFHPSDLDG